MGNLGRVTGRKVTHARTEKHTFGLYFGGPRLKGAPRELPISRRVGKPLGADSNEVKK